MTLKLTTFTNPWSKKNVAVFRNLDRALIHIRDHLLSEPECDGWALIDAKLEKEIPGVSKQRWSLYKSAVASDGTKVQSLYNEFASSIARATADSKRLGWCIQQGTVTAGLSKHGVLVLLDYVDPRSSTPEIVRTAFLPGQGSSESTRASRDRPSSDTGLGRERAGRKMRSGARKKWARKGREVRQHEARRTKWSVDERIFFDIFRPALQAIHRSRWDSSATGARQQQRERHEYALLKPKLPRTSNLEFNDWLAL